jgi:GDP-L-fucose synthase
MIQRDGRVLVTGGAGMVGAAALRLLRAQGFQQLQAPSRAELDLRSETAVARYFDAHKPDYVLMIAARVGGIAANIADPVGFLEDNLRMAVNLFAACQRHRVKKALFVGSSCIYPRGKPGLIPESDLLTAPLEPTNEGYALAKIVGLKLAKYYFDQHGFLTVCPMFPNIYGTGDDYDLATSHVLSALVRRFVDARDERKGEVVLWGTGTPRREFLHVDDVARAILFFMDHVGNPDHINVGPGTDITIRQLAEQVAAAVSFRGEVRWDASKPDGIARKCFDVSRMASLGFRPEVSLSDGIRRTIGEYEALKAGAAE